MKKINKKTLVWTITLLIFLSLIMIITSRYYGKGSLNNGYKVEIYNGDRVFKSKVEPRDEAEELVFEFFKIKVTDEYDKFRDILIENDYFNHYPEIYKEKFRLGLYEEEIIINNLRKLKEKEYTGKTSKEKAYPYLDKLEQYSSREFKVIEVNYTSKGSKTSESDYELRDRELITYFVIVKKDGVWRIFDLYGDV